MTTPDDARDATRQVDTPRPDLGAPPAPAGDAPRPDGRRRYRVNFVEPTVQVDFLEDEAGG